MITEKQIQGILIENIDALEDGLTILKKEQYIPHQLGTRGFIDIYAKDGHGKHVLIEIKRSRAASREAIHEIYKYVEGVKNCLNARDDEIRVILASTAWEELLVPFSRFVHDSNIDVIGYQLAISGDSSINSSLVDILDFSQGRMIAPWHDLYWHSCKKDLELSIKEIQEHFKRGDIEDFVLIVMNIPSSYNDFENASVAYTLQEFTGTSQVNSPTVPQYKYLIYAVHQLQLKNFYLKKVKSSASVLELDYEDIKDDPIDETYNRFFDSIWESSLCGYYSYGNAQNFSDFLNIHDFQITQIIKFGSFEKNQLLTNSALIKEIEESISSLPKFTKSFNLNSQSELAELTNKLQRCLENNSPWKAQINIVIEEQVKHSDSIDISIYNPETGLLGIYLFLKSGLSPIYLPSFTVRAIKGDVDYLYIGALEFVAESKSLRYILDKYYDGQLYNLTLLIAGDYTDPRHVEILLDLGLRYKTYKVIKGKNFLRLDDGIWCDTNLSSPYQSIFEFLESNESLIKQITKKIGLHHKGSLLSPNLNPTIELEKYFHLNRNEKGEYTFTDLDAKCDFCDCKLAEERYILDGKIKGCSAWAFFCLDCFSEYGEDLAFAGVFEENNGSWFLLNRKRE